MPLQGPIVVVADTRAEDLVEALRAAGAFPIVETRWADAESALTKVDPEALVLADACADQARIAKLADRLKARTGPFIPVVARTRGCAVDCGKRSGRPPRQPHRLGAAHPYAARNGAAPHRHAGKSW
jgi:hypothetical protein